MSFFSSGSHLQFTQRKFLFQRLLGADQQRLFVLQFAGAAFLEILFQPLQPLFHLRQVADHQIEFDVLDVAQRIDGADMRDRVVFKSAQHVNQRVHIAQAGQEGRLLERLLPDGRNIHILHRRVGCLLRRVKLRELVEPLVGHSAPRRYAPGGEWPRSSSLALVRILNNDVLPTCGRPMMPVFIP